MMRSDPRPPLLYGPHDSATRRGRHDATHAAGTPRWFVGIFHIMGLQAKTQGFRLDGAERRPTGDQVKGSRDENQHL
jgi:hypothetical protein